MVDGVLEPCFLETPIIYIIDPSCCSAMNNVLFLFCGARSVVLSTVLLRCSESRVFPSVLSRAALTLITLFWGSFGDVSGGLKLVGRMRQKQRPQDVPKSFAIQFYQPLECACVGWHLATTFPTLRRFLISWCVDVQCSFPADPSIIGYL